MKKRILSLIMLVVMVVTALPLAALTVFATTPEYVADDYNALYVQDGLVFAADFFSTNSYWNEAVEDDLNDYVWTDTTAKFSLSGGTNTVIANAISGGALLMNKITNTYLSITNSSSLTAKGKNGTTAEFVGKFTTNGSNAFAVNDLRASVSVATVNGKRGLTFNALGTNEASLLRARTTNSKVVTFHAPVSANAITNLTMTMQVNYTNSYWGTYPMLRFSGVKATAEQLSAAGITNSTSWQANFYATHTGDENGVTPREKVSVQSWIYNVPKYVTTDKIWDASANDGAGGYVTDPEGEKTYIVGAISRDRGEGTVAADFVKTNKLGSNGEYDTKKSSYTEAGHLGVYTNGVAAFESDEVYFINNGHSNAGGGNTYLKRQTMTAGTNYYAYRQYSRILSAGERAQNHMADLAKWFKIDITDAKKLTKASLIALAADPEVAALTFESDAADVEKAITERAAELIRLQPETAPTFNIDEYNTLYVQDGLLYAFDFFDTNATWGGATETLDSAARVTKAITDRVWYNKTAGYAKPISPAVTYGSSALTLSGGKVSLSSLKTLLMLNVDLYNNKSFGEGATMELVAIIPNSQQAYLNNIRIAFTTNYPTNEANPTGAWQNWITAVGPQSSTLPSKAFGYTLYTKAYTKLVTFSMVTQVPETTKDAPWGTNTASISYRVGTYITLENGDTVLSVSSTTSSAPKFYIPGGLTTHTTSYVDGVQQIDPETGDPIETTYKDVYIRSDYYVTGGKFAIYEDGQPLYVNDDMPWLNNTSAYGENNYLKQDTNGPTLAGVRYYDHALTATETARNSFADLAKWYGIDGTYLLSLNDESLEKLATDPAVLALDFSSGKTLVEATVLSKAETLFWEQFAGELEVDTQVLIANHGLDASSLFRYPKGLLPNTYTFLAGGFTTADNVKDGYEAAFKADMDALSGIGDWTPEQYDALYVKEGLQFAADFFKMNSYWNVPGSDSHIDYTELVPVGPAENNAYWYDANKNGVKDEGEVYDFTIDTSNHNTAAFTQARKEWATNDIAFLRGFRTYAADGTAMYLESSAPSYHADGRSVKTFSVFKVGDGYIRLREDMWGSGMLSLAGASGLPLSSVNTLQMTAATGGKLNSQPSVIFHGVRPTGSNSDGFVYNSFSNGFVDGSFSYTTQKGFTNSATVPVSLTYTILGGDAVGDDAFKLLDQKGTISAATGKLKNTTKGDLSIYIGWNGSAKDMRIYAMRYYLADLTLEQREQNHFADLAKFFRLNLVGFSMLPEARKQDLYKAVSGFTFTTARVAVQSAVSEYLLPYLSEGYEALKDEDETKNAFIDLGAEYLLDLNELLASTRDMSSVYTRVTAIALAGKSTTAAQKFLDDAIFDAFYYLSYAAGEETDLDALLTFCAGKNTAADKTEGSYIDLEPLMALPYEKRLGVLDALDLGEDATVATVQAAIDVYVAEIMAEYTAGSTLDYNGIYVQDELIFAADFFETNKYWGEDVVKDMNHYVWTKTKTSAAFDFAYKDGAIANGALLPSKWDIYENVLNIKNSEKLTNYAYGGTAVQYVGIFATEGLAAFAPNNLRTRVTFGTNKMNFLSLGFYSSNEQVLRDKNGSIISFAAPYVSGKAATVTMMMTVPEHTVDYYSYNSSAIAADQDYSYSKNPHLFQVTHEYDAENDGVVALASKLDRAYISYVPVIKTPAKIWDATANEGAGDWVENTGNKKYIVDAILRNDTSLNPWPDFLNNTNGGLWGGVNYYSTEPGHLGVYLNGTVAYDDDAYYPNNGYQTMGKGSTALKPNQRVSAETKLYAFRQYAKELTAAEMAQNHFADLAKWFKLDVISLWSAMSEKVRAELYEAVAGYTFDSNVADVQAAIDAVVDGYYSVVTEKVDEDFATLAIENNLNLDRLVSIKETELIKEITDAILAAFPVGYAVNEHVLRNALDSALAFLDSIQFIGVQVRIDSPYDVETYPGIRALFRIGEEELKALIDTYGEGNVVIGANVFGVYPNDDRTDPITLDFTPTLVDGELFFGEDANVGWMEDPDNPGEQILSFAYTVTYKKWQNVGFDGAVSYNRRYDYEFYVRVGDKTYTREVNYGQFGGTISAADAYGYFYENGFENDAVVKAVMKALGVAVE